MSNQLVWFRNDLRVTDNAALTAAVSAANENKAQLFAFYIFSAAHLRSHGASFVKFSAIEKALKELNEQLANLGISLRIITTDSWTKGAMELAQFCAENSVSQVHCHYEPGFDERERDKAFKASAGHDVKLHRYNDLNLIHPTNVLNKQGDYFKVFTPYKKALLPLLERELTPPLPCPQPFGDSTVPVAIDLQLEETWDNSLNLAVTESEAHEHLDRFYDTMPHYKEKRNFPSIEGTSKLSVALSLGTISSKQIVWGIYQQGSFGFNNTYLSEIIWRDFYKYLSFYRTDLFLGKPFSEKWDAFPWREKTASFEAWKDGLTGVPIVDAAMRQLNQTGWMHNRLRMIVGMYLVKILQVNWRHGEAYFAEKLADFDFSANNGGWQWVASTGVDAAPYFRIFNPYEQSRKFDPDGDFIRSFVPEIKDLDSKEIHQPTPLNAQANQYPVCNTDYKAARTDTLSKFKLL